MIARYNGQVITSGGQLLNGYNLNYGLLYYYDFDFNLIDSTGNGPDLTYSYYPSANDLFFSDGVGNTGASLFLNSNIEDFLSVYTTDSSVLGFISLEEFTFSMWYKQPLQPGYGVDFQTFYFGNSGGGELSAFIDFNYKNEAPDPSTNRIEYFEKKIGYGYESFFVDTPELSVINGEWHNIILRKRGNTRELIIDNFQYSNSATFINGINTPNKVNLVGLPGRPDISPYQNTYIDKYRFYNRYLQNEEIERIFINKI